MRNTAALLRPEDRRATLRALSKGNLDSREATRARILLALDTGASESQIVDSLETSRGTIWRTRKSYLETGLHDALTEGPRTGRPPRYGDDYKLRLLELAGSPPPDGKPAWTMETLTEAARKSLEVDNIAVSTVRRFFKQMGKTLADLAPPPPES